MARKPASEQGDTQQEIRAAAFSLFGRHGYDGVSLAKVAKAADITKAAVYWHYANKKELYLDCLRHLHDIFRLHIIEAMSGASSPALQLMCMFEGVGRLLHDPRIRDGVAGYWLEATTDDLAEGLALREAFEDEACAFLTATLEAGIDAGDFDMQLPAADMAQAIFSIVEASMLPLRRQTAEQTRRLLGALAHTFFRAHAPDPDLATRAREVGAFE